MFQGCALVADGLAHRPWVEVEHVLDELIGMLGGNPMRPQ